MRMTEKLKEILGINNPEKLVDGISQTYTEKKENGDENPIDTTVDEIMEKIMENPNPDRIMEILKRFLESKEIPDRIVEKTAARISKNDQIPDKIITEAVEKSKTDIPDKVINTIIEEGDIDVIERLKLMRNVEDPQIIEQQVKNELNILYMICGSKRDSEVLDRIEELKELLKWNISEDIQNLIQQVVAKKMAENYYSETSRGTKIYTLSRIMPVEEMIEKGLIEQVSEEYQKLEEKEGEKEGRFSKTELRMQILNQMAKDIAYKYEETGIFIIPQSENMKKLGIDEIEDFISYIQTFLGRDITDKERTDIEAQIKGYADNIQVKESLLINKIKRLPNKNKKENMDLLIKILSDNKTLETLVMLDESNLIEQFNSMSDRTRKKTIESIGEVIAKRKYKLAQQSPKIKDKQQIKRYKKEDREM